MIHYYKTTDEIAIYLASVLEKAVNENGQISIALSGGNTPKLLFQYWATHFQQKEFWHHIHYYWVDERCVSPSNIESNFGIAFSTFIKPLNISKKNIFRIYGENNPSNEAKRYNELLLKNVIQNNEFPQFDLILLGIGEDGHTASIFPGNEKVFKSKEFCIHTINPYNRQNRITITGTVINNAKSVFFIITGDSKKGIFTDLLNKNSIKTYPAKLVKLTNSEIDIITDIVTS